MQTVLWNVFEILVNLFQGFVYAGFAFGMLRFSKSKFAKRIAFFALALFLCIALTSINYVTIFEGMGIFVYSAIIFIFVSLTFDGGVIQKIAISILPVNAAAVGSIFSVNIVSYLAKAEITDLMSKNFGYRLITVLISNAIFLAIALVFIFISKRNEIALDEKEWLFVGITLALSIITFYFVYSIAFQTNTGKSKLYMAFAAVGLTAINIINYVLLVFLSKKHSVILENSMLHQQLHFQEQSAELTKQQYVELRKARHDFDNVLGVIRALNDSGQKEKISEYISEYKKSSAQIVQTVKTDNEYINAIINSKLLEAYDNGVKVILNIPQNIGEIYSPEICSLIGNMFDNAIEACEKCDDNRRIILEISCQNGLLEILMKNSISSSVLVSNPTLETSKSDKENHGFGTKVIREIAENNHGYVDFYEDDGMFCCLASVNNSR